MNMATFRLLALALSVFTSFIFCNISPAISLTEGIDDIFGQLTRAGQPEFLDPDDAFILSTEVVSENLVNVHWEIAEGYYLYQDKFSFLFQNKNVTRNDNITIIDVQLPEGKLKNDPDFGSVQVNYHEVDAQLTLQRNYNAEPAAELVVKYQGCKEDALCYPPISKTIPLKLITTSMEVGGGDSVAVGPNSIGFGARQISEQDTITERLVAGSFMQNIIIFFGFGLLLALTPCVFPMIPILSGLIVRQGSSITTLRSFYMSLTYVLAMALTYAVLGVIAGSFSFNLQAASQNVWVITAFSGVFVLLALSMFGFYELQLPSSWQNKLSAASDGRGGTLHGVATMGVLSAIIVGPCVAPPLAGALLYISQTGNAVFGGLALFSMGMGMGVLLLVVGTSTGKLLPKAGAWMESTKYIFGVLMLGVAIWFMERVLPGPFILILWAGLLIVSATYMGALERSERRNPWQGLWRGLGLAMLVYGVILVVGAASGGGNVLSPLEGLSNKYRAGEVASNKLSFKYVKGLEGLEIALDEAANKGKFVMLDFYADWCITCKEMEHDAFSDPGVQQLLNGVILLQADVTENDAQDKALLKAFSLYGPPAILFFNKKGIEKRSHRVVGFMNKDDFLKHIHEVMAG